MVIVQLGHPQPVFANQSLAPVESGCTLVAKVTSNKSRMFTLFVFIWILDNQSPVGRFSFTGCMMSQLTGQPLPWVWLSTKNAHNENHYI